MLENVSQLVEQAATNVSRREFLGGFGRVECHRSVLA
jgi:hypothetical protein